ncbi:hypothetical protein QT327_21410 [Olivibacter sp. 47]|uniref:hypothetical protein n=1 Tax=Olivibacter sp. 47 TaxID=3056486 RepID=UPI0025A49FAF|nr:hypothetical protein [Olivibacter sp. 47]MDM8176875.1 hypothetical protein [Olivibacter sp. 47]
MSEFTNINSTCTKNQKKYRMTAEQVAALVPCSVSYVNKIRQGTREDNSPKAKLVREIDLITNEGTNKLIEAVKQIVKL